MCVCQNAGNVELENIKDVLSSDISLPITTNMSKMEPLKWGH